VCSCCRYCCFFFSLPASRLSCGAQVRRFLPLPFGVGVDSGLWSTVRAMPMCGDARSAKGDGDGGAVAGARARGDGGDGGGRGGRGGGGTDITEHAEQFVQAVLATPRVIKAGTVVLDEILKAAALQSGEEVAPLTHETMEAVRLPKRLFGGGAFTVVLRQHTLDVAAEALLWLRVPHDHDPAEFAPAVLLTGSPGIGKTEAFTVALLRGLVRGDAGPAPPVIIIEKRAVMRTIKIKFNIVDGRAVSVQSARKMDLEEFRASDPDLDLVSTVYIVDPAKQSSVQGSPPEVTARTVVVASPNSIHFKQFMTRRPRPLELNMRHWTLAELLVARSDMSPETDAATTVARWVRQGGVPRIVFNTGEYLSAMKRTATTIRSLPLEVVEQVYDDPHLTNVVEGGDQAPNSAVLTYVESEPPFTRPKAGFLSRWVEREVWRRLRVGLMRRVIRGDALHGVVFERLALIVIGEGGAFRVGYLPSSEGACVHVCRCVVASAWCDRSWYALLGSRHSRARRAIQLCLVAVIDSQRGSKECQRGCERCHGRERGDRREQAAGKVA
jgi:hypothetical protein